MAMLTRAVGPFAGVGLFTGVRSSLRFLPAAKDTGIRVQRLGFDQVATQRALVTHVVSDSAWAGPAAPLVRNTTLMVSAEPAGASAKDASKVAATIEHAMAALAGLHVWDAVIEIDAAEVPILDGSARAFVEGLREAVVVGEAGDEPQPIVLTRRVEVREKDASIVAEPVASMRDAIMTYNLDFAGRGSVGAQTYSWCGESDVFVGEIAAVMFYSARTAEILIKLIKENRLASACPQVIAICMSDNIADAARGVQWKSVRSTVEATEEAMIAELEIIRK